MLHGEDRGGHGGADEGYRRSGLHAGRGAGVHGAAGRQADAGSGDGKPGSSKAVQARRPFLAGCHAEALVHHPRRRCRRRCRRCSHGWWGELVGSCGREAFRLLWNGPERATHRHGRPRACPLPKEGEGEISGLIPATLELDPATVGFSPPAKTEPKLVGIAPGIALKRKPRRSSVLGSSAATPPRAAAPSHRPCARTAGSGSGGGPRPRWR